MDTSEKDDSGREATANNLDTTANRASPRRATPRGGALFVGAGILLSRIIGLVRERAFAHFFGNSDAADAFKAALRIPNFLQNLLGEGALSACFIPVYSRLLAEGREQDARRLAGGVLSLLFCLVALLVLAGMLWSDALVSVLAPGFPAETRELTAHLVQVLFPGIGVLVFSAWCLSILNSHHRFFLPYAAPVAWNSVIIAVLLWEGPRSLSEESLAVKVALGVTAGSVLQCAVQVPSVLRLLGGLTLFSPPREQLRTVLRNFLPSVTARGVVQISALMDNFLASLLPSGSVAALSYAQMIYTLPVSLFGMSVSISELPAMSRGTGTAAERQEFVAARLAASGRKMAYFIIPSAVALLCLGEAFVGLLFQTGKFDSNDTMLVWMALAGSALGLVPATQARLRSSAFFAFHDTVTPMWCAIVRVVVAFGLGFAACRFLPELLGVPASWGLLGLTAASALGAWLEYTLLSRSLRRRLAVNTLTASGSFPIWGAAVGAGATSLMLTFLWPDSPSHTSAVLKWCSQIVVFGGTYLGSSYILRVPEAVSFVGAVAKRLGRASIRS